MSGIPHNAEFCVECQCLLRCSRNGVLVAVAEDAGCLLDSLYEADMWYCPGCHKEVLKGFSKAIGRRQAPLVMEGVCVCHGSIERYLDELLKKEPSKEIRKVYRNG